MMLYNLYLQSNWRKKTDTSEEISHIRWYTDVFRLVFWFFQLFHQTLIPHLLSLGCRVSEKVWGAAASSFTMIKTCQYPGKLTNMNEKIKLLQGHIHSKLSFLSSCTQLELCLNQGWAPLQFQAEFLLPDTFWRRYRASLFPRKLIPYGFLLGNFPEP